MLARARSSRQMSLMRAVVLLAIGFVAASATAEAQPREQRFRLELLFSGERHFGTMIAERPEGGEAEVATRLWTGGFDVCPGGVVRPWLHLGGCLGVHVATGSVPGEDAQWFADTSPTLMGRAMVRSTFLAPRYLRGGVDLVYRSYLGEGRESALELGLRLGVEARIGQDGMPVLVELAFRAPLVTTRSESTYAWPVTDAGGAMIGFDARPTRGVRIFTLGLVVGTYWGR